MILNDFLPPAMERARRRRKALSPDEIAILHSLYEYRVLNVELLTTIIYRATGEAEMRRTYRRLARLRDLGLARPYERVPSSARGGGGVYMVTDVGIRTLAERGLIAQRRKARDNRVSFQQLTYILEVNRAAIVLSRSGWKFEHARDVKAAHGLNRGDPIAGRLSAPDGRRYTVYYMASSPKEKTVVAVVSQMKTIAGAVAPNVIVFVGGVQAFDLVVKEIHRQEVLIGGAMHVLPYKYGVRYLERISTAQKERAIVERILGRAVDTSRHPWFRYETKDGVVIPLFNHDLMAIEALRRYDSPAVVIMLDRMRDYITFAFDRPGIRVVEVPVEVVLR